jgi:hypothetical protein
MKKITFSLLIGALAASSALAGQPMVSSSYKGVTTVAPPPCFKDQEFQVDLFGSFTQGNRDYIYQDGAGGGVGINYFFIRNLGIGVDGNYHDGDVHGVWSTSASLIYRWPIEGGNTCWAPYLFAGGGYRTDGKAVFTEHAGAGIEWRINPTLAIFGDGRYTWAEHQDDSITTRLGVRFVF